MRHQGAALGPVLQVLKVAVARLNVRVLCAVVIGVSLEAVCRLRDHLGPCTASPCNYGGEPRGIRTRSDVPNDLDDDATCLLHDTAEVYLLVAEVPPAVLRAVGHPADDNDLVS